MNYCKTIEPAATPSALPARRVKSMGVEDIPEILELENICWLPEIRASEATLRARFEMGHISMGMFVNDKLVGLSSFSYTRFSPDDPGGLPATFQEFSTRPKHKNHNTAFVYNLNIHPDHRGDTLTRELIWAGIDRLREDNCIYMLGVGRCPSYNGSQDAGIEGIQASPEFRKTIDNATHTGRLPATRELIVDPVLRFYRRTLGCKFLRVVPEFLPGDTPSGNFGVIFYKTL